jgi:ribosomal protein S18 acetylase RimI-like enzyme
VPFVILREKVADTQVKDHTRITIQPLADADLPRCAEIMAAQDPWKALGIGVDRCRAAISGAHLTRHGLYLEGRVTGLAVVHPTGFASSPYLVALAVEAAHTGRGLGSRLLTHVEEEVFRDRRNLFLCVTSFNERAQRFYLARGYVQIGVIQDFFKPGVDELIMRKVRGEE